MRRSEPKPQDYRPTGAIAQVESGPAHQKFVNKVEPQHALVKIQHARRLLNSGETASSWSPEGTTVITSTAIRDKRNNALPLEHNGFKRGEWDIVREFEPDFHLPADRPDYVDVEAGARYEEIESCMAGTLTLANHLADGELDTTVIPWIKGVTPAERRLAYRTIEQLGMEFAAFYANGYFNDGSGVRIEDLIADVEQITTETAEADIGGEGPLDIIVLNCLSPNVLRKLPENVVAGSGLWVGQNRGWREKVTPTTQTGEEMREIYGDVCDRVAEALGQQTEEPRSQRDRNRRGQRNQTSAEETETETEI